MQKEAEKNAKREAKKKAKIGGGGGPVRGAAMVMLVAIGEVTKPSKVAVGKLTKRSKVVVQTVEVMVVQTAEVTEVKTMAMQWWS